MKQFMDKDFLLTNEVAKELFFDVANTMPIVDYHCHIDPKEIAEDRKFENITQVWLGGDHYNGVKCVQTEWTNTILLEMHQIVKNSRSGQKRLKKLLEIHFSTGLTWNFKDTLDTMVF